MPKIIIPGESSFEAPIGKRLILALEDAGVDVLHRCGGFARCTTCRVEISEGEPNKMTQAERDRLSQQEGFLRNFRLSCQIRCEHDMVLTPHLTKANTNLDDPGPRPQDNITPDPVWVEVPYDTGSKG